MIAPISFKSRKILYMCRNLWNQRDTTASLTLSMEYSPSLEVIFVQLLKKLSVYYDTRKTVFIRARLSEVLSYIS